jgi:hypothetical protein
MNTNIKAELPETTETVPLRGSLMTLALFLLGNTTAIRRLAATPYLWAVGLLLTFSAGLAREYDAEYLIAEPWHLLIAPGASLAAVTVLWLLLQLSGINRWQFGVFPERNASKPLVKSAPWGPKSFLIFLGLFWLTAPLAWIYGVPYETYFDQVTAARYNIYSLLLVALWRVFIMVRVLHILFGMHHLTAAIIILFFGDGVLFIASNWWEQPVIGIMGGLRLDGAEAILAQAKFTGQILSLLALFPLGFAWLSLYGFRSTKWLFVVSGNPISLKPLVALGSLVCCFWVICLFWTQPAQQRRWQIEHTFKHGQITDAIKLLDAYYPDHLPPLWDPPPRFSYNSKKPEPLFVLAAIADRPADNPIRMIYENKLLQDQFRFYDIKPDEIRLLLAILEASPNADRLVYGTDRLSGLRDDLEGIQEKNTNNELGERAMALLLRYPKRSAK